MSTEGNNNLEKKKLATVWEWILNACPSSQVWFTASQLKSYVSLEHKSGSSISRFHPTNIQSYLRFDILGKSNNLAFRIEWRSLFSTSILSKASSDLIILSIIIVPAEGQAKTSSGTGIQQHLSLWNICRGKTIIITKYLWKGIHMCNTKPTNAFLSESPSQQQQQPKRDNNSPANKHPWNIFVIATTHRPLLHPEPIRGDDETNLTLKLPWQSD